MQTFLNAKIHGISLLFKRWEEKTQTYEDGLMDIEVMQGQALAKEDARDDLEGRLFAH